MEDLYDPEEKILCPYNSAHHIRRCKMSFHLVKCKKNYPDLKLIACDFNTTHRIPEPELRYHHQICPDRKKIEAILVPSQNAVERLPIPKVEYECEENWDDENVPTYNPQQYLETHNVLRHLDVAPGSQRREFRFSERQRLGGLTEQNNVPPAQPSSEEQVTLPPHRPVTHVAGETKRGNKVYVPFKGESSKKF